jgi:GTP-binding protein
MQLLIKLTAYPVNSMTSTSHDGLDYNVTLLEIVADIPGLVKGAHQNVGLGHSFLKHIERCHALLYVIDVSEYKAWQQLKDLSYELDLYHTGLSSRPAAIIANKIDLEGAKQNIKKLQERTALDICPVSAMLRHNIDGLRETLWELYRKAVP